jgi:hypothetical protein
MEATSGMFLLDARTLEQSKPSTINEQQLRRGRRTSAE